MGIKKEKKGLANHYTLAEISAAYKFSMPTLRKYIESGELEIVEIFGHPRVTEEALAALARKPSKKTDEPEAEA